MGESMDQLPNETLVDERLEEISQLRGQQATSTAFMAICLWRADSDRFEIDFHELER